MKNFNKLFGFCLLAALPLVFLPAKLVHAQSSVVYPLHIGDYWMYQAQIIKEITKDTVMSNGFIYSKKVSTGFGNTVFQRLENDSVFQYYNDQDRLFYDFSRSPGDTVSTIISGLDTLDITLQWTGTANIFGRERRQWKFYFDMRHIVDEEEYHWITDSLGLTKWMSFWFQYQLEGAVINGDTLGIVTAIKNIHLSDPSEFRLLQNYPNPFNASTQIRFKIPKSAFVSLKIYNVLGEEVSVLLAERLHAGEHSYNWDASGFASGLYYFQLAVNDFREVKKMILMK